MRSLSIRQAVERLGVSRRTVYYWIASGKLATVPAGPHSRRITITSVEQIEAERQKAAA